MDQFSIFQLLNLLCVFPLISMMIKEIVEREQKYVLTQHHETATSEVCVLKEVFVRNGSSAKIQCGAECNKVFVGRCKFVDVIKGDRPMCRLISGFKTPENVSPGHPSGQFVRFKKVIILCLKSFNFYQYQYSYFGYSYHKLFRILQCAYLN